MMQRFNIHTILIIYISITLMGCAGSDVKGSVQPKVDLSATIDSFAFGKVKFGTDKTNFIQQLDSEPVQNQMTEPLFNEKVTEIELPIKVGTHSYSGYYYFDNKDRLYKILIHHQNENRLVRTDHDEAYDTLYEIFKGQYGTGTIHNGMPGLKAVHWNLKNKKIELSSSCLASNCNMECTIIETRIFGENKITNQIKNARLHLKLKRSSEVL